MDWSQLIIAVVPAVITIGTILVQTGKLINILQNIEVKINSPECRMDKIEVRMDKLEARMDKFERHLYKLAISVGNIKVRLKRIEQNQ